jgi:hypothetical protein
VSFREIAITLRAVNRASNEFAKVGADATRLSSQVNASQNSMAQSFKNASSEASIMGNQVKEAQGTLSNSCKTAGAEASNLASQVNNASNTISSSMQKTTLNVDAFNARIKTLGTAIIGIGASGTAIAHIAHQFGLLNDSQTAVFSSAMMVVSVMGTLTRTGTGLAIAQKVYSAACWIATAAQNALNISYGTFLALTGVGIAVIVAAAAAMWSFSSSMNSATDSVKNFNTNATEIPQRTRNIQRSTENPSTSARGKYFGEAAMYRRGVE